MARFQPSRSAPLFGTADGMCATSHPLAAKTLSTFLERGGNARWTPRIAGAVLLGICETADDGDRGDCFVLYSPRAAKRCYR